jgi:hypothetical protein
MESLRPETAKTISLERLLAIAGAALCLVITIVIWVSVSRQQEMWPLPALYLIEMVVAAGLGLLGIFRGDAWGEIAAWAVVGLLVGFAALGALSIGFAYLPVMVFLALAAIASDRRHRQRLPLHLGAAVIGGAAQVALMLVAIRVLYPNAVF